MSKPKKNDDDKLIHDTEVLLQKYDNGILLLKAFIEEVISYLPYIQEDIGVDRGILDDEGRMQITVLKKSLKYQNRVLIIDKNDKQLYAAEKKCYT